MDCVCTICGKTAKDYEYKFWRINMGAGKNDPYSSRCKECFCDIIELDNIESFRAACEELDHPFIKKEIRELVNNYQYSLDKQVIIGRYLSKMRLKGYYSFRYEDSDFLNKIDEEREQEAMRRRGFNV